MNLFDSIILNIVLLTFPLILWLFYMTHNKNIGKPEKELLFDFSLITSLYLIIRFGITIIDNNLFLIVNVPLIIAYLKRREKSALLLSLMIIVHYFNIFDAYLVFFIIEYILYYLIYKLCTNNLKLYISIISLLKIINFVVLILFTNYFAPIDNNLILNIIGLIFNATLITFIAISICCKAEDIVKYHMSLKELEQEKQFRNSLFRITHEIKNPIAVCKGYLDMFDVKDIKHSQKYIPILKEEIERTLILLQDFLCITKIQIEHDFVDINMTLEDVLDNFVPILKDKKINYEFDVMDDSYYIYGDYNRMTQVFINIIKNAIEAVETKENGELIVKTTVSDNNINIHIIDNGVGFTEEQLKRLGEPFLTNKPNGTGLGISLSQEIIKSHNGLLQYFSEPNQGTTVEIIIPLVAK